MTVPNICESKQGTLVQEHYNIVGWCEPLPGDEWAEQFVFALEFHFW